MSDNKARALAAATNAAINNMIEAEKKLKAEVARLTEERDTARGLNGPWAESAAAEMARADSERARAEKAEAACAVMRAALEEAAQWIGPVGTGRLKAALATDAGAALLAERDALRAACKWYEEEGDHATTDEKIRAALEMGGK